MAWLVWQRMRCSFLSNLLIIGSWQNRFELLDLVAKVSDLSTLILGGLYPSGKHILMLLDFVVQATNGVDDMDKRFLSVD